MRKILLAGGQFTLVDDGDFEMLRKYKWHTMIEGRCIYAVRRISKDGKQRKVFMHRVILGTPKGMETDHRNGNGLDNRRSNLRICTRADNMKNLSLSQNNTSGFKGVHYSKERKKWRAQIKLNYETISLGSFDNIHSAAEAYKIASIKYFGDFARIN